MYTEWIRHFLPWIWAFSLNITGMVIFVISVYRLSCERVSPTTIDNNWNGKQRSLFEFSNYFSVSKVIFISNSLLSLCHCQSQWLPGPRKQFPLSFDAHLNLQNTYSDKKLLMIASFSRKRKFFIMEQFSYLFLKLISLLDGQWCALNRSSRNG